MNYKEFAEKMRATPSSEGLLYDYSVLWLHPENLPYAVVSIGNFKGTVLKPPRRVVNTYGLTKPVNAISLKVPNGVTDLCMWDNVFSKIWPGMLRGCVKLKRVTIPKDVKHIFARAFKNCTELEDVYYEGSPEEWDRIEIVTRKHEIEFGKAIPGTPVLRIESERYVHIPGNEPLMNANIHFNCDPDLCYDENEKTQKLVWLEYDGNRDPENHPPRYTAVRQ